MSDKKPFPANKKPFKPGASTVPDKQKTPRTPTSGGTKMKNTDDLLAFRKKKYGV